MWEFSTLGGFVDGFTVYTQQLGDLVRGEDLDRLGRGWFSRCQREHV
jgi:hypothetical protein